jgi:tocopherol O-methyltransferase
MHRPAERLRRDLTVDTIRDHYDQFAQVYRLFWGEHVHHGLFANRNDKPKQAQDALLRLCADQAEVKYGARVIDVGCGYGGTARFLAREYACSVLGLTISATQHAIAQKLSSVLNHKGSVRFEVANAQTYLFPCEHFDLVWNMESSKHFSPSKGTSGESRRR